jgi:hypothetical protein
MFRSKEVAWPAGFDVWKPTALQHSQADYELHQAQSSSPNTVKSDKLRDAELPLIATKALNIQLF